MKPLHLPILLALLLLAACSPGQLSTPIVNPTTLPPTSTPIPPTDTPAPTDITTPTETPVPLLSPQATFEVIAAVHAYVLIVEDYETKDISPEERQAIISPIIEFGVLPLGYFFDQSTPDPQLAGEWRTADGVYRALLLNEIDLAAEEMIESAAETAKELGVETAQYGVDYAGAIDAANALLPEIATQPLPESPALGKLNPELIPVQITPFVFDFAGSEVFYTIGTIENTSTTPQQNVTIEITYYNFLDEHIGTVRGRLLADVANPGSIYPFIATDVIAGEEAALMDQTHYEVTVYSAPAERESYQDFEISLQTFQEISGEYHLICQITPIGDQALDPQHLNIGVTAYDANQNLVGVGGGTFLAEDPSPV